MTATKWGHYWCEKCEKYHRNKSRPGRRHRQFNEGYRKIEELRKKREADPNYKPWYQLRYEAKAFWLKPHGDKPYSQEWLWLRDHCAICNHKWDDHNDICKKVVMTKILGRILIGEDEPMPLTCNCDILIQYPQFKDVCNAPIIEVNP